LDRAVALFLMLASASAVALVTGAYLLAGPGPALIVTGAVLALAAGFVRRGLAE
jgi:hypothetical protein